MTGVFAIANRELAVFALAGVALLGTRGAWEPRVPEGRLAAAIASGAVPALFNGGRIDLNTADAETLAAIPGIGVSTAERIVGDRAARGLFSSIAEVDRVSGVGATALRALEPYAEVAHAVNARDAQTPAASKPRTKNKSGRLRFPVDPNTASLAALEALPGVGPVTAQAILADRTANGPYLTLQDLDRVKGIGPKTLERLQPLLRLEPSS